MSDKLYKSINNERIELTTEEVAELETKKTEGLAEANQIQEEIQAKENLKASAKTKLMNGEALTEDEANVMVGL
jgi:ribosomal protein L9